MTAVLKVAAKTCNISLEHANPKLFIKGQWRPEAPSVHYLTYRLVCAAYFLVWWLITFIRFPQDKERTCFWDYKLYFFTFLTDWGITALTVDICYQAVLVAMAYKKRNKGAHADKMTTTLKVSWALESCNNAMALCITFVYWTFLYRPDKWKSDGTTFHVHVMNSVYVYVNQMVTARPVYFNHVVFPLAFGSLYVVFNLVYFLAGGLSIHGDPFIYSILDWRSPGKALFTVAANLFLVFVCHAIHLATYQYRVKAYKNWKGTYESESSVEMEPV